MFIGREEDGYVEPKFCSEGQALKHREPVV
jgi:hypothetical protein